VAPQPATYLNPGLNGVFSLFLHRLRPEKDLAEACALAPGAGAAIHRRRHGEPRRSRRSRACISSARSASRAPPRSTRASSCPNEVKDPEQKRRLAETGAAAGKAFDEFAAFLEKNKEAAKGQLRDRRAALFLAPREKELLPFGARELREKGREQWDLLSAEANRIAKEIDGGTWQETCDRLNKVHAPTPEGMRAEYEEWTEKARTFLRDTGLVTLPKGEECAVEPSPPFQRPILAVASYNRPPAFKDTLKGHFFVPYPPDGTSADEVQKRLEEIAAQASRRPRCTRRIPVTTGTS
jgi:hypothetical protein